jgi:hypothetical protein
MRLLSIRPVRSTIPTNDRKKIADPARLNDGAVVWEGSGFAIETMANQRDVTRAAHDFAADKKANVKRERFAAKRNLRIDTSSDLESDRVAKRILFSDGSTSTTSTTSSTGSTDSQDDFMDDWLERVYTVSQESTIEIRKEVSRVVLRCLMSSTDDSDRNRGVLGMDRYAVIETADRPQNGRQHEDAQVRIPTMTRPVIHRVSPLASTLSGGASVALTQEAARAMELERQRIREEIVKSLSIGTTDHDMDDTDDWPPGTDAGAEEATSSVEHFLLLIGFNCFVPKVPQSPEHPFPKGNRTISWMDSISLSTLSY